MGGEYNKTLVSVLIGILILIDQWWGIGIGSMSSQWVTTILVIIESILVYWVRNHPA